MQNNEVEDCINQLELTYIFIDDILEIVDSGNLEKVKDVLFGDLYPEVSIKEKEKHIFISCFTAKDLTENNKKILNYLIFDYNISEENSIDYFNDKILNLEHIKKMFQTRSWNKDIRDTLQENNNNNNKKLKV